jgi:hypothetical protein
MKSIQSALRFNELFGGALSNQFRVFAMWVTRATQERPATAHASEKFRATTRTDLRRRSPRQGDINDRIHYLWRAV